MITLRTKTNKLNQEDLNKIALITLMCCKQTFGINPKKRTDVRMKLISNKDTCFGCYCPKTNTIKVYTLKNQNVEQLIQTIIHEYTHYLQNIWKYYYLVHQVTGYENNPFELEASRNEMIFYKPFWTHVKKFV
jgi:hypothetical protein